MKLHSPTFASTRPSPSRPLCASLAGLALAVGMTTVRAENKTNDFPTVDRVNYVMECMRDNPGPHFEMVSKCSCALDALAREAKYDDYVSMNTAFNANTLGGERGNAIRDAQGLQAEIKRYRELQSKVKKGCFINPDSR